MAASHDFENSHSNLPPSLKRSRPGSSCDSEHWEGACPDMKFSWRNHGPVRRVKRNVKWAFQLESFPAPDFQKRRPVFGLGQVKSILKRSMVTLSDKKESEQHVDKSANEAGTMTVLKSHPVSLSSSQSEPSTNSDVSCQFEEDVCDAEVGDEQVQKPLKRRTKFKLLVSPQQSPSP